MSHIYHLARKTWLFAIIAIMAGSLLTACGQDTVTTDTPPPAAGTNPPPVGGNNPPPAGENPPAPPAEDNNPPPAGGDILPPAEDNNPPPDEEDTIPPAITDQQAVEAALAALQIGFAGEEGDFGVTQNLDLPGSGLHDTTITWSSDRPELIDDDGIVNQPLFQDGNAEVILTATISKGSKLNTGEFPVQVIRQKGLTISGGKLLETDGLPTGDTPRDVLADVGLSLEIMPGSPVAYLDNLIFFAAKDQWIDGYNLWRSDGTAAGTFLLKLQAPGALGANDNYRFDQNISVSPLNNLQTLIFQEEGGVLRIKSRFWYYIETCTTVGGEIQCSGPTTTQTGEWLVSSNHQADGSSIEPAFYRQESTTGTLNLAAGLDMNLGAATIEDLFRDTGTTVEVGHIAPDGESFVPAWDLVAATLDFGNTLIPLIEAEITEPIPADVNAATRAMQQELKDILKTLVADDDNDGRYDRLNKEAITLGMAWEPEVRHAMSGVLAAAIRDIIVRKRFSTLTHSQQVLFARIANRINAGRDFIKEELEKQRFEWYEASQSGSVANQYALQTMPNLAITAEQAANNRLLGLAIGGGAGAAVGATAAGAILIAAKAIFPHAMKEVGKKGAEIVISWAAGNAAGAATGAFSLALAVIVIGVEAAIMVAEEQENIKAYDAMMARAENKLTMLDLSDLDLSVEFNQGDFFTAYIVTLTEVPLVP
ncbi:hypothetical protein QE250_15535 [Chromatiaceae bacterium AAb-1]|nr:hypothetical protein [Chromatiaceae bacterium AAb-1]